MSKRCPPLGDAAISGDDGTDTAGSTPSTGRPSAGFGALWLGETTSALGSSVSRVALPLVAVAVLHATTFQVSALAAASWLPWLLIGLPAGAWVDRLPRRNVMITCDLLSAGLLVSATAAAWVDALGFLHLLIVAFLTGAASVPLNTAFHVYVPAVVPERSLQAANSRLQGSEAAAQIAGPSLAGLLAQAASAVAGVAADAVSFLVSAACLFRIKERDAPDPSRHHAPVRADVASGLRLVAGDPYLRVLTAYGALTNLALVGYQAVLVVFLLRDLHQSPATVGILLSSSAAGGIAGAAAAAPVVRRFGSARALIFGALITAPFGLLIPLAAPGPRVLLVAVGGATVAAGVVGSNVIKDTWRQQYCLRAHLGRVLTSMQVLNYGAIPAGALLAGAVGAALGLRSALLLMTGLLALAPFTLFAGPLRLGPNLPKRAS